MGPKEVTKKVSSRLPTSKKGEAGGEEGDSEKEIDFSSLTIAQLKEKMRERGMASPQLKARWNAFEALIYCYNWRDAKIKSLQRQIKGKIIILTPPPSILHNSCNKEDVNYLLLESVPRNLVLVMLTRGTKTIVALPSGKFLRVQKVFARNP